MNEVLLRRQRFILTFLIGLGVFCVAALWTFEVWAGLITDFDRYGYPFLIGVFGSSFIVMIAVPQYRVIAETVSFTGFSLYFIVALSSFVVLPSPDRVYTVANALQWMPVLYVGAFVFFRPRRAMIGAVFVFIVSLVPAGILIAAGAAGERETAVTALVGNAYAVHFLIIVSLSFVSVLTQQYIDVSTSASIFKTEANTDALTGIANRRGLSEGLLRYAREGAGPVALILFDIDHFKSVNDRFGHAVGDEILRSIPHLIGSQLRGNDLLGRWGGEEFLVAIPPGSAASPEQLAERVRHVVQASDHPVAGRVTLSAGLAYWNPAESLDEALIGADRALYRAKEMGRDRTESAEPGASTQGATGQ